MNKKKIFDIFIIGGGINGCGIARDASGRGLQVCLAEMGDIGSGTSSASTKLIHGGLRYLKYFDFKLVRESLKEREVLLKNMPHICWPMRFILPAPTNLLQRILVRLGLLIYDNLGGRTILPGTKTFKSKNTKIASLLKKKYSSVFVFSDCWVEDSRLVILNAVDAKKRGASILTHTKVTDFKKEKKYWRITTHNSLGQIQEFFSYAIVNASGPWVNTINHQAGADGEQISLVKGSHLVFNKLFEHDSSYFLLGNDGRIIFLIPFQEDFTLVGTTEVPHENILEDPKCSLLEKEYLIEFVNKYFNFDLKLENIVWSYSGVRPLYKDSKQKKGSVSSITRDYKLKLDTFEGLPILNIYGGKLTTYRKLSENVLLKLNPYFTKMKKPWTSGKPLPGGDFDMINKSLLIQKLSEKYCFLDDKWCRRLINCYGTLSEAILEKSETKEDLGVDFGHSLTEAEVVWLINNEFASCAEDILWRRTKLGLKFSINEEKRLSDWFKNASAKLV